MNANGTRKRRVKIISSDKRSPILAVYNDAPASVEIIEGRIVREGESIPAGQPLYMVRKESDGEHYIETLVEGSGERAATPSAESKGPAKVASTSYRSGYDAVFGKKKSKHLN